MATLIIITIVSWVLLAFNVYALFTTAFNHGDNLKRLQKIAVDISLVVAFFFLFAVSLWFTSYWLMHVL